MTNFFKTKTEAERTLELKARNSLLKDDKKSLIQLLNEEFVFASNEVFKNISREIKESLIYQLLIGEVRRNKNFIPKEAILLYANKKIQLEDMLQY